MLILSRLAGTLASVFRIGTLKLKDVAGTLVLRNATDTQHANLEINRLKMIYGPANGAILSSDANGLATWKDPSDLGLGANEFTDLIDVPDTYIPGKFVAVNEAGDGLEFVDAPAGGGSGSGTPLNITKRSFSVGHLLSEIVVANDGESPFIVEEDFSQYDRIEIEVIGRRVTGDGQVRIFFNNDTNTNNYDFAYEAVGRNVNNTVFGYDSRIADVPGRSGYTSNEIGRFLITIPYPGASAGGKHAYSRQFHLGHVIGSGWSSVYTAAVYWTNTAAITRIALTLDGGWEAGSFWKVWGYKSTEVVTDVTGNTAVAQSQALITFEGNLEPGVSPLRIYNATDTVKLISKVFLSLSDAPTGADVIVDVHKDGISIFASQDDRPKVLATETTGETLLDTEVEWAPGEYLTAEIDQIGSTFPGANLVVHVIATGELNGGGGGGAITIQEADGEPFVTGVKTLKVPNGTLVSEGDGVARLALGQYDPGPDFDASNIEGLYCWYKSDTGVTLNGRTVSQWEDIGPFAYHATQGTGGRQPFYIPLSPLAGYPAIAFDGVDDFLVTNAKPALGANPRTLVAVGYGAVSQPGGGYMHIVHYGHSSGGEAYGITSRTNGSAFFGNHYWSNQMVTAVWGELGPFILLMTYNGTTDYCYYNGLLVGTRNVTLNTGSRLGLHIGSRIDPPSECGRFCLTELMAFNRYLEASERIDLVTALGLKYRINTVT